MKDVSFFPMERNRYFYGKLLTVRDFEAEQNYASAKRRLVNRVVHGAGVVCGLGVSRSDDTTLLIGSGIVDKTSFSVPSITEKKSGHGKVSVNGMVRGSINGTVHGIMHATVEGDIDLNLISGSANEEQDDEED